MDTLQEKFSRLDRAEILQYIFHPRKDYSDHAPEGIIEHFISVDAGVQIGTRMRLTASDAPHILFFHGSGEIASEYDDIGPIYNRCGFSFIAVDFRGYGKSTGEPTASSMIHDAHAVYADIKGFLKESNRTGLLVLMGRSLGSVSAIELAASYNDEIAALILDSAFASTVALLERIGVPGSDLGISEEDGLINVKNIAKVTRPTLIIHGQRDALIPLTDIEALMSYAGARKRQLIVVPGADHDDIITRCGEAYFQTIQNFVIGRKRTYFRDLRKT